MTIAHRIEIIRGLDHPCSDILVSYDVSGALELKLCFSHVNRGYASDLTATFSKPVSFVWESESYGLVDTPDQLPKCSSKDFEQYTYPVLEIEGSNWVAEYARMAMANEPVGATLAHFLFVSLNDIVHVLTSTKPTINASN